MRRRILLGCVFRAVSALFMPFADEEDASRLWDGRSVRWDTGPIPSLLEASRAVRVSLRGIQFYDHAVSPLSEGYPCRRVHDALCVLEDGTRILPVSGARYGPPTGQHRRPLSMDMGGGTCRVARVAVSEAGVYELSECDLARVDVVWADGLVYVDPNTRLPTWAYVMTAVMVLFLVMSLGQNISALLGDPDAAPQPWFTEGLCAAQCALVLAADPRRVWASDQDRWVLAVTLAYVAIYLLRHSFDLLLRPSDGSHVYTLNVITGTLILVTARLYGTFETPYATIFLTLLMARLAHKLLVRRRLCGVERLVVSFDSLYVAVLYQATFLPSFFDIQVTCPIRPPGTEG